MADLKFNTTGGQTIAREMMVAYLNTGDKDTPVWSPLGKRVESGSIEFDWSTETTNDILGNTWTTGKKATRTTSFEPCDLDADDAALVKIWNLAVKDDNVNALLNQDVLLCHFYAGTAETAVFAERYSAAAVMPSGLGGDGGGTVQMPVDITFSGERTTGTASRAGGVVTFTPDTTV